VSRSSTELEFRAMVNVTCELVWIKDLLTEVGFPPQYPMRLYCYNQAVINRAENPLFHECTKHIDVDCHLIRQKIKKKIIQARRVSSDHQLDLLTKSHGNAQVDFIYDKLDMYDVYALA